MRTWTASRTTKDRCPGTTRGVQVDAIGCFKEVELRGVLFDTSSSELSAADKTRLDEAIGNFKRLPPDVAAGTSIVVEGHTDNTGPEAYNQALSERRADAVKQHFVAAGTSRPPSSRRWARACRSRSTPTPRVGAGRTTGA
ncbi:MAG: OmpA family protein [Gammaproteobacteria bacterium]|nr:OmpA family protein [Gammaproteobacteria bacterium]